MKDKIFKKYANGPVGGYVGWIEIEGECVAFVDVDSKITWMEDLD